MNSQRQGQRGFQAWPWRRGLRVLALLLVAAAAALAAAESARAAATLYAPPRCPAAELRSASEAELLACYAPQFAVRESEHPYNRIGGARAEPGRFGGARVRVDPERPALYTQVRRDSVAGRPVLQLVYRLHFERIPLRFSKFFFEAHRNPGLLVVLTLDAATRELWFATAVHSCGCYLAVMPTERVPAEWLPNAWPRHEQQIYGQRLPAMLPAFDARRGRLRLELTSGSHRVAAVSFAPAQEPAAEDRPAASTAQPQDTAPAQLALPLVPLEELRRLPLGASGRTVSFFHEAGFMRGRVRGAWNPLEGLTLFGLAALDPTVGTDKDFGDPRETGVSFYTFLAFWRHDRSRLDHYDGLLRALGYLLPAAP